MAAPPEVNTLDLSGTFVMNKSLSDDTDDILRLQGVSWFMRKLIAAATITLYIKHYKDNEGVEHIDIDQVGTGGFSGNREERTLDWSDRDVSDRVFGPVKGKSHRIKVEDVEDGWHKEGPWTPDTNEHGLIEAVARSDTEKSGKSWSADIVWGFSEIEGARRHIRKVHFRSPEEDDKLAVLVYDYQGPNTRA